MRPLWRSIRTVFSLLWKGVDQARRLTVNLVFLVVVVVLTAWWWSADTPTVPDTAALVLALNGNLVEELSGDSEERALLALLGEEHPETLLRAALEAVELASEDERIQALFLDTERLAGAGLSKMQTLATAIEEFKQTGKPVVASADYFSQSQYYLAATADEIYMHPMGVVFVPGYGSYRNYYKEALDKLEVDWHVFRVGEYKSAVEPYLRSDMSPEAREARQRWLGLLWQAYRDDVQRMRQLEPGTLESYADGFPQLLRRHGGDAAAAALAVGLVDRLMHRDEVRQRLIELVGEDEDGKSYSRIGHSSYLAAVDRPRPRSERNVAVIVAQGGIYDGWRQPGSVGGDSLADLIRQVREDETKAALVLRVDSPGGSAFASEIIRREVELTREAGKPVVVSMSSVAASGGYWISMSADEIWAAPTTLTGSIGIYAMLPTFPRTLERFGVHNDGVGTGEMAGTLRPERPLPAAAVETMEMMIQQGYRQFIEGVAAGRGQSTEEIDAAARGRVWAGSDALDLGLVDQLGDLQEAAAAAARLAGLEDDFGVEYVGQPRSWRTRILEWLVRAPLPDLGRILGPAGGRPLEFELLDAVLEETRALDGFGDPNGLYAYCFCEPH